MSKSIRQRVYEHVTENPGVKRKDVDRALGTEVDAGKPIAQAIYQLTVKGALRRDDDGALFANEGHTFRPARDIDDESSERAEPTSVRQESTRRAVDFKPLEPKEIDAPRDQLPLPIATAVPPSIHEHLENQVAVCEQVLRDYIATIDDPTLHLLLDNANRARAQLVQCT